MVAIYLRVSSAGQIVDSQELALTKALQARGITEWLTYRDEGISGAKASRPGLNRLLADIGTKKVTCVYCYSLSRVSRSVIHLLETLQQFEKAGVGFVSITEAIDIQTATGKLLLTILGSIAQFEREIIVSRVKAGLEAARKRGKILGRKKTRNSELIRKMLGQGMPYRKIAEVAGCSIGAVQREVLELGHSVNLKKAQGP